MGIPRLLYLDVYERLALPFTFQRLAFGLWMFPSISLSPIWGISQLSGNLCLCIFKTDPH